LACKYSRGYVESVRWAAVWEVPMVCPYTHVSRSEIKANRTQERRLNRESYSLTVSAVL
jgi:hypothetical protein